MPKEMNGLVLAQAKDHAVALLALLPEVKASLKEAGINGSGRRLTKALEGNLLRLMEQLALVEQSALEQPLGRPRQGRGLAALYGVWAGTAVTDEAIEAAKFRSRDIEHN